MLLNSKMQSRPTNEAERLDLLPKSDRNADVFRCVGAAGKVLLQICLQVIVRDLRVSDLPLWTRLGK